MNLRENPATDASILLQLEKGHPLHEIQRDGDWVQVATGLEEIKSGWVYAALISTDRNRMAGGQRINNDIVALFKQAFAEYNRRGGKGLFPEAEYRGDGVMQVTATDAWLARPLRERQQSLNELFALWAAAVGEGVSISVDIADEQGQRHMTMFR